MNDVSNQQEQSSPLDSVTCPLDGISLVEAAAGTGKTYNIQNLVVRFILEKELSIESIVVVTFTEAAADELRTRLRAVINACCEAAKGKSSDARAAALIRAAENKGVSRDRAIKLLTNASLDFDRAAIGTIHGFCQRLLKDFAFESGSDFNTEVLTGQKDILDNFALDAFRHFCYKGEYSELYVRLLSADTLKKLTKIKSARKDLILLPQASTDLSLEQASEKFLNFWSKFKGADISAEVEALANFVNGNKIRIKSGKANLISIQKKPFPEKDDLENLQKYTPANLENNPKKGGEEKLTSFLKENKFFHVIGELYTLLLNIKLYLRDDALRYALSRFEEFKRQNNFITYDDMLFRAGEALKNEAFAAGVRKKFLAGIIDEFQDTDPVQWQIFHTLFARGPLFLVGDPRQAIYSFRGGDLATYLEARKSASACYTLTTNYRSCDELLNQINIWFGCHSNGFAIKEITLPQVQAPQAPEEKTSPLLTDGKADPVPLKILRCDTGEEFRQTARIINYLLTADNILLPGKGGKTPRKLRPEDIAVLAYKNDDLQAVKKELTQLNIPSTIQKSGNVFLTRSGEELQKILFALLNMTNTSAVRWALGTNICGLFLEDLAVEKDISEYVERLVQLKKIWEENSFQNMFRKLLAEFKTELRLAETADGLRHMTDLIQLGDLLHQAASRRQLSPQALYDHLICCRLLPDDTEEFAAEQETDNGAVILCTEHKSKGLQYPVVILPGLNSNGQLPDTYHKNDDQLYYGIESDTDKIFRDDEFLQENLRRGYVALTRAENACYVVATPVYIPSSTGGPKHLEKRLTTLNWLWSWRESGIPDNLPHSVVLKNCTEADRTLPEDLVTELEEKAVSYTPEKSDDKLSVRSKPVVRAPRLTTSFSGLAPGHSGGFVPPDLSEKEDDENTEEEENIPPPDTPPENDPLHRLKGKTFGLLLHGILEKIDFKAGRKEIRQWVEREIRLNGPTEEELSYCTEVIFRTLEKKLIGDLHISDIPPEKRCAEMKFDFTFSNTFEKGDLRRMAASHLQEEYEKHSDDETAFSGGFFTGFVDLFFEHEGKYYVLDWKSNLLPDYSREMLKASISQSFYQMQYLIYLAAIIRFLKQRLGLKDFSQKEYDQYIGGAFYIYMRGAVSDDPAGGVFFDRPDFECMKEILEVLK